MCAFRIVTYTFIVTRVNSDETTQQFPQKQNAIPVNTRLFCVSVLQLPCLVLICIISQRVHGAAGFLMSITVVVYFFSQLLSILALRPLPVLSFPFVYSYLIPSSQILVPPDAAIVVSSTSIHLCIFLTMSGFLKKIVFCCKV